jgi:hypothetical protein
MRGIDGVNSGSLVYNSLFKPCVRVNQDFFLGFGAILKRDKVYAIAKKLIGYINLPFFYFRSSITPLQKMDVITNIQMKPETPLTISINILCSGIKEKIKQNIKLDNLKSAKLFIDIEIDGAKKRRELLTSSITLGFDQEIKKLSTEITAVLIDTSCNPFVSLSFAALYKDKMDHYFWCHIEHEKHPNEKQHAGLTKFTTNHLGYPPDEDWSYYLREIDRFGPQLDDNGDFI